MGWRDIIRSPDPSRALYEALRANPTASRVADTFQGGFEGAMEGLGSLGHAATIPARALAGAATNLAGTQAPVDVSDYALYGRDLETGLQGVQYGDLLAGTLEDAGEIAPGGKASEALRFMGNVITDPGAAAGMLSGAEAVGALAGRMSPTIAAQGPSFPRQPRSMLAQGYTRQTPTGANQAPPGRGFPGGGSRPAYPGGPSPLTSSAPPRRGAPGGPVRTGPSSVPVGPGPGPTATQRVPVHLQGSGQGPVGGGTQPVPRFNPSATQEIPFHPDATQRVPMTRGPGGKGAQRPKAARKSRRKPSTPKKDKEE